MRYNIINEEKRGMRMPEYIDPKVLADGKMLLCLKADFIANQSYETLLPLLGCLRDSEIYLPAEAVMSAADEARLAAAKGKTSFVNEDDICLSVDLLVAPDKTSWVPIFSQKEQIPKDYAEKHTVIKTDALHALELAHRAGTAEGLMLDAFTESVMLTFKVADVLRELPSHLPPRETENK